MKVGELIAALSKFDLESEVRVESPTGDYWRTHVAREVTDVRELATKWSDYSRADKIIPDNNASDEDATDVKIHVVVCI